MIKIALNWKNKTTFTSPTLWGQIMKVVFFSCFDTILATFWLFFGFWPHFQKIAQNWPKLTQILKIRPLLFLKLFEVKLWKWCQNWNLRHISSIFNHILICAIFYYLTLLYKKWNSGGGCSRGSRDLKFWIYSIDT